MTWEDMVAQLKEARRRALDMVTQLEVHAEDQMPALYEHIEREAHDRGFSVDRCIRELSSVPTFLNPLVPRGVLRAVFGDGEVRDLRMA